MRRLLVACALVLAGCGGGGEDGITIYLSQRLGPEGPPGQVTPVLVPVEREPQAGIAPARQALLALQQGPSPGERARGFLSTFPLGTWPRHVDVSTGTATVALAGTVPPGFSGAAAAVYSLLELPAIERVRLRFRGEPCCVQRHDGTVVQVLTRETFRFWSGEPCAWRTDPTTVRCRDG